MHCTHRMTGSPEYKAFQNMHARCYHPTCRNYAQYGGRGITVCAEWDTFEKFYADMGDRPGSEYSIDRIDNNGPYSKENCRWATLTEQGRNRRTNVPLTWRGETLLLVEWAPIVGISAKCLATRVRYGWDVERVLTFPVVPRDRPCGITRRAA